MVNYQRIGSKRSMRNVIYMCLADGTAIPLPVSQCIYLTDSYVVSSCSLTFVTAGLAV